MNIEPPLLTLDPDHFKLPPHEDCSNLKRSGTKVFFPQHQPPCARCSVGLPSDTTNTLPTLQLLYFNTGTAQVSLSTFQNKG